MKVIDLGSGILPAFARCAREFGAQVYTVDVIGADRLVQDYLPTEGPARKMERDSHICTDLNARGSINLILEESDGEFDVVTSAKLHAWSDYNGKIVHAPKDVWKIAKPLLKPDRPYYNADRNYMEIKTIHERQTIH